MDTNYERGRQFRDMDYVTGNAPRPRGAYDPYVLHLLRYGSVHRGQLGSVSAPETIAPPPASLHTGEAAVRAAIRSPEQTL